MVNQEIQDMNAQVRKLLSQGEIEQAAKLVDYDSYKLQEYLNAPRTDENTYECLQDLGEEIVNEILNLLK